MSAQSRQADGKILAGGFFSGANSIGGQTRNRIARLETDCADFHAYSYSYTNRNTNS